MVSHIFFTLFLFIGEEWMNRLLRKILYFVLAFLMIADFYLIFNAGNPDSFLRLLITDTSYDVTVTVAVSIVIGIISLLMMRDGDQNSVRKMIERNSDYIKKLKNEDRSDDEIAESFLKELGAGKFTSRFLEKKIKRYLAKIQ